MGDARFAQFNETALMGHIVEDSQLVWSYWGFLPSQIEDIDLHNRSHHVDGLCTLFLHYH